MSKFIAMFFLMCLSGVTLGCASGNYYGQSVDIGAFVTPGFILYAEFKPGVLHEEFLDGRQITVTGENAQFAFVSALVVEYFQGTYQPPSVRSDAPVEVGWRS